MLIALHRLKQLGKQKVTKNWLQMSNQSETETDRLDLVLMCWDWCHHEYYRVSGVMICVLWREVLWILLLSLLVSFWLPAVNQIRTNLKTPNHDSLIVEKNKRKCSECSERIFLSNHDSGCSCFFKQKFACTNCQIFMTYKILILKSYSYSMMRVTRQWSEQQNRYNRLYSFCWNYP